MSNSVKEVLRPSKKAEKEKIRQPRKETPRKTLIQAKEMFFAGHAIKDIKEETGMSHRNLQWHVRGKPKNWEKLRTALNPLFKQAFKRAAKDVKESTGCLAVLIKEQVKMLLAQEKQFSVKELKLLSDIFANFDRVYRQDEGLPTDIIAKIDLSPKEVKENLCKVLLDLDENDPMKEYEAEAETARTTKLH